MNPRIYGREWKNPYYDFDPPWFAEHRNVFVRVSEVYEALRTIERSIKQLETIEEQLEKESDINKSYGEVRFDAQKSIWYLIEAIEVFMYNFPDLEYERWFDSFWQDVASVYGVTEAGEATDSGEKFLYELKKMLRHVPDVRSNRPKNRLDNFLREYGNDLRTHEVGEKFQTDVFEARDLFCLGYYSSALFVLGRAVETILLEIGHWRKIRSLDLYGATEWDEASFKWRTEALYRVDDPTDGGKVLNNRQYHEIQILVDYRNNVAHSDYKEISKEKAIRQLNSAFDLLMELSEVLERYEEADEEEIGELRDLSVN